MNATARSLLVTLLLLANGLFILLHADVSVPLNRPFGEFPVQHAGWTMQSQHELSANVENVLKATDYLSRTYISSDGAKVSLYLGYHSGGKDSGGIHSPRHCLPGSGWFEISTARERLDVGGTIVNVVRAVYQKGESREMFIYWFQVRDRSLNDEYSLKIAEVTGSLFHRRRDTAFIRVSIPYVADEAKAREAGERFIRDFYPVIRAFLPG